MIDTLAQEAGIPRQAVAESDRAVAFEAAVREDADVILARYPEAHRRSSPA